MFFLGMGVQIPSQSQIGNQQIPGGNQNVSQMGAAQNVSQMGVPQTLSAQNVAQMQQNQMPMGGNQNPQGQNPNQNPLQGQGQNVPGQSVPNAMGGQNPNTHLALMNAQQQNVMGMGQLTGNVVSLNNYNNVQMNNVNVFLKSPFFKGN